MTTITKLNTKLKTDFDIQITKFNATMHALNQCFTEVMECFPTTPTTMPAHKKSKGLGIANYCTYMQVPNYPYHGIMPVTPSTPKKVMMQPLVP